MDLRRPRRTGIEVAEVVRYGRVGRTGIGVSEVGHGRLHRRRWERSLSA